jgi:putative hydrolase of the HAD superfamily
VTLAAICFDATGTLIETAESVGEVYRRVAREFGVDLPARRLEDAFRRILQQAPARGVEGASARARQDGEIKWWFERVRETFQAADSTARFEDFRAFADALFETYRRPGAWRLRPGTLEMLTELDKRTLPMAIVSNFDHRLPEILELLDISSFFEVVMIPSMTARAKPDRAVFEAIAERHSLPPNRLDALLYVGDDSKETLRAIEELGLQVIDVHRMEDQESLTDRVLRAAIVPQPHSNNDNDNHDHDYDHDQDQDQDPGSD